MTERCSVSEVPVAVLAARSGARNPELPRLQAALPLVRLKATAPRNVEIEYPGGGCEVRPFRGLRRIGGQL